jgi:hypothetical protein
MHLSKRSSETEDMRAIEDQRFGLGIAAMFATEYRAKKYIRVAGHCLRTKRQALPAHDTDLIDFFRRVQ